MPKKNPNLSKDNEARLSPGTTPELRENQLIALAINLAEKQLREGTASSQVITHYLKLGSTKERLEKEILVKQRDLLAAKTKSIESGDTYNQLVEDALRAFKEYGGENDKA